ncbi:MAG: hypothetical protein RLN88_02810 [Ekhidna sp.]|uniref:hypothetical protein n=1 Tax=Ekhidna sp. TaxID=2608089 RepID=UPI0032EFC50C
MRFEVVPSWWILIIAVVVLVILIYWDVKSRNHSLRGLRIAAMILAVLALIGLYVRPYFLGESKAGKVVLSTTSSQRTDSLISSGFKLVADFDELIKIKKERGIDEPVIVGEGLEAWEIRQLSQNFMYFPEVDSVEGPYEMKVGDGIVNSVLPISFRFYVKDSVTIFLRGTGIDLVEQVVTPEVNQTKFEVIPAIAGKLTYELLGIRNSDTLFRENVPVIIQENDAFNVLILAGTPSFETRFLKNHLAGEGYGVAERLQVSRETHRESFTNLENRSLRSITTNLLEDFKILVMDQTAFDDLSGSERRAINASMKRGEIGILWLGAANNDWLKTREANDSELQLKDGSESVEIARKQELIASSDQIVLQSQVIGEIKLHGLGRVVVPAFNASYQLQLKGHSKVYAEVWNELLHTVSGYDKSSSGVFINAFPRVGEPLGFSFPAEQSSEVLLDSIRMAIAERWDQPGIFTATGWPKKKGWNYLKIAGSDHPFFVFEEGDWEVERMYAKMKITEAFAKPIKESDESSRKVKQPISRWIFFALFVLSFGFLWVEQRIN